MSEKSSFTTIPETSPIDALWQLAQEIQVTLDKIRPVVFAAAVSDSGWTADEIKVAMGMYLRTLVTLEKVVSALWRLT